MTCYKIIYLLLKLIINYLLFMTSSIRPPVKPGRTIKLVIALYSGFFTILVFKTMVFCIVNEPEMRLLDFFRERCLFIQGNLSPYSLLLKKQFNKSKLTKSFS